MTSTGAGWGNPYERLVEAVRKDVRDEYITVEAAEKNYGVLIDPGTLEATGVTEERGKA